MYRVICYNLLVINNNIKLYYYVVLLYYAVAINRNKDGISE